MILSSGGRGVLGKNIGREAQHKLEKWTQSNLTGFKKRGSIGLEIGKKGVNWIEYQHNQGSIRSSLAVWGVWGCWKGHPIGLKISKTRVITAEPPYHAHVWEYPPRDSILIIIFLHSESANKHVRLLTKSTLLNIFLLYNYVVNMLDNVVLSARVQNRA